MRIETPSEQYARELSEQLDRKIANYMEDEEFDPELLALAERAIQAIEARKK
jgi:hypothetical protein